MKNIAITGGGTGGHLSIARAFGIECKKRGFNAIYIGSTSGQDKAWFESSDIFSRAYFLQSMGVVNKRGLGLLKSLWLQIKAVFKARAILKNHNIEAVISEGGFSAGGASGAAILARIPLFIHEQNSTIGTLNKILAPFAKAVFGSFDLDLPNFVRTAYPIDEIFRQNARTRREIRSILFLGGSQGAVAINDFALQLAQELIKCDIKIIHQCGKGDFERVKNAYKAMGLDSSLDSRESCESNADSSKILQDSSADESKLDSRESNADSSLDSQPLKARFGDKITLFAFDKNIAHYITKADLCVSRAGASSLWELVANRAPCYFVPYPFAAKNHQLYNALFLQKYGLCEVARQRDLSVGSFLSYLDSADFAKISANLGDFKSQNGAKEILDLIIKRVK